MLGLWVETEIPDSNKANQVLSHKYAVSLSSGTLQLVCNVGVHLYHYIFFLQFWSVGTLCGWYICDDFSDTDQHCSWSALHLCRHLLRSLKFQCTAHSQVYFQRFLTFSISASTFHFHAVYLRHRSVLTTVYAAH